MNRTVRNGLAIAGMAGGMWFLGQAVAQADVAATGDIATSAESSATAEASGSGSGDSAAVSSAGNENLNVNLAAKVENTEVSTGPISTGNSIVVSNSNVTGGAPAVADYKSEAESSVTVDNHNETTIKVDSSVNDSNNPAVNNGHAGGDKGNVVADGNIESKAVSSAEAESNGDHGKSYGDHGKKNYGSDDATAASDAYNSNTNINGALDLTNTEVSTGAITTGNDIVVNNENVTSPEMNCAAYDKAEVTCNLTVNNTNITNIHVDSSVNNSNNPQVGNTTPAGWHRDHHGKPAHHEADCPEHKAAPAAMPETKYMAPAAPAAMPAPVKAAPVKAAHVKAAATVRTMSSAQPSSQLASTGADVSVPLTVGLLTLTAGMGLAFATRRSSEAQAA